MSDIVEWLQSSATVRGRDTSLGRRYQEAADEIERLRGECNECAVTISDLRAEIERLQALVHPFEDAVAKVEEQGKKIERLRRERNVLNEMWVSAETENVRLEAVLRDIAEESLTLEDIIIMARDALVRVSDRPPQDDPEYLHPVLPKDEA